MGKIKKIYKYTLVLFILFAVLPATAFFMLRIPSVQTYLGNKFMDRLSDRIAGSIEFSKIQFSFFNHIKANDLLIRDFSGDTLIYSPVVNAGLRSIKRKERSLKLGRISVEEPIIKLQHDTTGILNLQYFINLIIPADTAKRNRELSINRIRINDGKLSYKSGKERKAPAGVLDPASIEVTELYLNVEDLEKLWTKISLNLTELSLKTDNGFELTNLFTKLDISSDHIHLIDPTIRTKNSFINSDILGVNLDKKDANFNFLKDAGLDLQFNSSLFSLKDLGYFLKELQGYDQEFTLDGRIRGSIAELKGRNINIIHSDTTNLLFDFDLSGLPEIEHTFMFIDVEHLSTHTAEIESVKIPGKGFIDLGAEIRRLGNIDFSGNFTGFISDFVTYGRFTTDLGLVSTDILFKPSTTDSFVYSGSLELTELNLGKFTGNEDNLGFTSFSFEVDGSSKSFDSFRANLQGVVDSVEFNNYKYKNIHIDGIITERIFDGSVTSDTRNLKMDLLGRFDFSDSIPELDFSLNLRNANLKALKLDIEPISSNLSLLLTANVIGNKVDNLSGELRILNSRLERNGELLELYDASLKASEDIEGKSLEFQSDFMDALIVGNYNLTIFASDIRNVAYSLVPSLAEEGITNTSNSKNSFNYSIDFKNSDRLNDFFNTGFRIAEGTFLKGRIEPGKELTLVSHGDYLTYKDNSIIDYNVNGKLADSTVFVGFNSYKANLAGRIDLDSLSFDLGTLPDSLLLDVFWTNPSNKRKGLISLGGSVSQQVKGNPIIDATFLPTILNINGNQWKIFESHISIDSSSVKVDNFKLAHNEDLIHIDGIVSANPSDSVHISFNNLNLATLNTVKQQDTGTNEDKIEFLVGGRINGNILITDLYGDFIFESDINVKDFKTNEHEHGDVMILSEWNTSLRHADIQVYNNINGARTFSVDGFYDPENTNISLLAEVNRMPLDMLNLVLYSFASGVNGYATGNVSISGHPSAPLITGNIMAADASMMIDYLQTRFMFSDTIKLVDYSYRFDSIEIRDERGNRAILDGYVNHDGFKNFDVGIRIDANNLRVLDTRQKDNNLFYGTAFASGLINIKSEDNDGLDLNISARTEQNTRIFFPLSESEQVSDYSFISFIKPVADSTIKKEITLPINLPKPKAGMGLDFNLDVTQDAEIQLVFDASVGDVLRSTGSGNLNMSLEKDGSFSMYGDYTIEDGDYQLTLGNIFNKRFIVEEGGKITWNGDITNAVLDIKAIYKLKASLYEILLDPSYKERIPVECHLNMSGQLIDPVIGFDIYLPTADEKMRTDLRNAINSDEEMSRQFLYLIVMNSFYPDPTYASATGAANSGASAMGATTIEMLSNQMSNWLSQISNDFDIGFAYRPGNDISSQEVEVALSTQLLDDKVTINGNFAVAGHESSNNMNDLTGDFDVEVKLTEKVRLKVFNRSNDNLYYETAPYTQGFGFFFRQEFDKIKDIFRRKNKDAKKEDDIEIVEK